ncbi:hypothetical protein AALC75_20940 [Lachnospiraceae bacterium 48-42]
MNRNLEEIIQKVMKTIDIINEYGEYVDAYVKEQTSPIHLVSTYGAKGIKKAMFYKENEKMIMMVLDSAIKKFTQKDILLEIKEPLKQLGIDISDYIDKLDAYTVGTYMNEIVKNIDKNTIESFIKQIQSLELQRKEK